MKNFLLALFSKLSYNQRLRKVSLKIFKYFPKLKVLMIELRDNGLRYKKSTPVQKIIINESLLKSIKQELQNPPRINSNTQNVNIILLESHSQSKMALLCKTFPNINFILKQTKNEKIFLGIDLKAPKEVLLTYLNQKKSKDLILDCLDYNSDNELLQTIALYYNNQNLYEAKINLIQKNYSPIQSLRVQKKAPLIKEHLKKLQFVFISINLHNLQSTIKTIDKYCDFVKQYIIVTSPKNKLEFQKLQTKQKVIIIDETTILEKYAKNFSKRDHQSKNYLLRASLLNIDFLEEEFIMLDDDNQILKAISIEKFIRKDGKYNAYYFHDLLQYHHKNTAYDKGQVNTKEVLLAKNYKELLSYSSHCPQIINKSIYKEALEEFLEIGETKSLDEWSIYFNYALTYYPSLFNKKVFQTLNWPANPSQFDLPFSQDEISFENYYQELYQNKVFTPSNTYEEKLAIKQKQEEAFIFSKQTFQKYKHILRDQNMLHGVSSFKNKYMELHLLSIPYFIVLKKDASLTLSLNYKLQNLLATRLDLSLVIFQDGKYKTLRKIQTLKNIPYEEAKIDIPISSKNLQEGIYDISFHILHKNTYIDKNSSPYFLKLIVSSE